LDDLRDGQVVTPSKATDFTTIMETLADADLADYAVILPTLDGIQLDPDRGKRQKQVDELRDLLSKGKFQERLAAAKILAASGDVEDVPHLIYALTDGDHRITVVARDGLRLISRKFSGYRLGDKPTKEEKEFAAGKWGEWYRSVRPSAVAVTDASEE
jgi:HEAT repeat protein